MPFERTVRALSCAALAVLWAAPAAAQRREPTRDLIDAVERRCPATHPSSRNEGKGVFAGRSTWGRDGEWHVTCTFTANEYHFASGWRGDGLAAHYVDDATDDWPAQLELAGCNGGGDVQEIDGRIYLGSGSKVAWVVHGGGEPAYRDYLLTHGPRLLEVVESAALPCPEAARPAPTARARLALCRVGRSLGQAVGREALFGKAFGAELPPDQVAAIARHVAAAAAAIEAAEATFQPPFSGERPSDSLASIQGRLDGYMAWRAGRSPRHRVEELENLAQQYRRTLAATFVSSRADALRYQVNCDSQTLETCFQFGRASIAAGIPPADRASVGATAYQGGALGAMRNAIREGQQAGLDGPRTTGARKVCCNFGTVDEWNAVPPLDDESPPSAFLAAQEVLDHVLAATPARCGSPGAPRTAGTRTAVDIGLMDPSGPLSPEEQEREYSLARDYYQGSGGRTRDGLKAFQHAVRAAGAGHAPAQNLLGVLYGNGVGVPQNDRLALEWKMKAAEAGNAAAQSNVGWHYENGRGTDADMGEAERWYRRSAEQGWPPGMRNLGFALQQKGSYAEALAWFRRAADAGHADAMNDVGLYHQNGWSVAQDYAQAARWYRRAAEQGQVDAMRNLARLYENGWGVPADPERARYWWDRAGGR